MTNQEAEILNTNDKDETRWLSRLLGVMIAVLDYHLIIHSIGRFRSGQLDEIRIVLGLVIVALLAWLSWRLIKASTLWIMSSWICDANPYYVVLRSRYFNMNKHLRCGLVAGVMALLFQEFLQLMWIFHKGVKLYEMIRYIYMLIFWPSRSLYHRLQLSDLPPVVQVILCVLYIFIVGFLFGWVFSFLKQRFIKTKHEHDTVLEQLRQ